MIKASLEAKYRVKNFGLLFVYTCPWFRLFETSFFKFLQFFKYIEKKNKKKTWPSGGLYNWVKRLLNSLGTHVHYLWNWGHFSQIILLPQISGDRCNSTVKWHLHLRKTFWKQNFELRKLCLWFEELELIFPNCYNAPNTLK